MTSPSKPFLYQRRTHTGNGWEQLFGYEFDLLEAHRAHAAASLASLRELREEEYDDILAYRDPVDAQTGSALAGIHADAMREANELLPRLQWNAQFLVVYGAFEHMLNMMCKIVAEQSLQTYKDRDGRATGIDAAQRFLERVTGHTETWTRDTWKDAQWLKMLRNKIVHQDGLLDFSRKEEPQLSIPLWEQRGIHVIPNLSDARYVLLSDLLIEEAIVIFRKVVMEICTLNVFDASPLGTPGPQPALR